MTTKRVSILSLTAVLILVMAVTAGFIFSSLTGSYVGGEVRIAKADVTVNNITVDTSTMTIYDENIAATAPSDAVAIATAEELRDFLNGSASYGYLTADLSYDKEAMASARTFAEGRTLNGNGHTITLTTTVSNATSENFGLLVDVNEGTLENLKVVYSSNLTVGNAGAVWAQNNVGILTGKNSGIIRNCDLSVSGSFTYNYNNTQIDAVENKNDVFVTAFGGFAGANSNLITNILLQYQGAQITLNTYANYTSQIRLDAKAVFGGAVGASLDASSECSNVIAVSDATTSVLLSASKTDGNGETGVSYREAAAVQANISAKSNLAGKVDNVIVYWQGSYDSLTNGTSISRNAVVNSGNATNVTAVDMSLGLYKDQMQNGNINFLTLHNSTAKISVRDGVQYLQITPSDNRVMATQEFKKYVTLNTEDTASYENLPVSGMENIYLQPEKQNGFTLELPAYQTSTGNYWSLTYDTYERAKLTLTQDMFEYTGTDYINTLFLCGSTPVTGGNLNLKNGSKPISQVMLPGVYNIAFGSMTSNVAYVDAENKLIALDEDQEDYVITINYANIATIPAETDWLPSFRYNFLINGAEENAADGYVYEVNGSLPKQVEGLIMESDFDTSSTGRTYKVYLTKDGNRVTNIVEFNVKVDANAPVISDVTFDKPVDVYYNQNFVMLKAFDYASGVANVTLNNKPMSYDDVNGVYEGAVQNGKNVVVAIDAAGNQSTYEFEAKIDVVKPVLKYDFYYYDANGEKQTYTTIGYKNGYTLYANLLNTVFGNAGGKIYYQYIGEDEWLEYTDVIEFRTSAKVKFKAVSNTLDYDSDAAYEVDSGTYLYFNVGLKDIVVTDRDIVIGNKDKTFDGTNNYVGTLVFADNVEFDTTGLTLKAYYAQTDAGNGIAITVEVLCDREDVHVINETTVYTGNILKKEISVSVANAEKVASQENPVFTYTTNQIEGFEEEIILTTDATVSSLPGTYDILLAETEYKNYVVTSYVKGVLTINKYVIDRMVYDFTTISGLDTSNIKAVVVGFKQLNGEYVDFVVSYEYSTSKDGAYEACEGMSLAGYYRVMLSLPEDMKASYEIKAGLESFIVKVIDAEMFTPEVEGGENEALEYFENYAQGNTDADNTTIVKDYETFTNPQYVVILAVFCLCILATIFAVSCGRILIEKHKDSNRNKKA